MHIINIMGDCRRRHRIQFASKPQHISSVVFCIITNCHMSRACIHIFVLFKCHKQQKSTDTHTLHIDVIFVRAMDFFPYHFIYSVCYFIFIYVVVDVNVVAVFTMIIRFTCIYFDSICLFRLYISVCELKVSTHCQYVQYIVYNTSEYVHVRVCLFLVS